MSRLSIVTLVVLTSSVFALAAPAQTPTCNRLKGTAQAIAKSLLESEFVYACCDDTIARCLARKRVCRLAYRLAENICARAQAGQSKEQIQQALTRRAATMTDTGARATFDLDHAPVVGNPKAPVVVVEYACARCPFCGAVTPPLYDAIATGPLKDKVRLYFRPFPIAYHEHSKEANLALMAAIRLGHFWPFMKLLFQHFEKYSRDNQLRWAKQSGMDEKRFLATTEDDQTRELLVQSKKEGLRNKINATPTFFINGRKYDGDNRVPELVDVLEEEYERAKGLRYRD